MDSIHPTDNQQKNPSSNQQVEALAAVIAAYGLDAADLISAVQNLAAAKQATAAPAEQGKSIYQDKESIYDDEHTFVYRRGTQQLRGITYGFTMNNPRNLLSKHLEQPTE